MKVKVTFICENDKDASVLGNNKEQKIKEAYTLFAEILSSLGEDKMTLVSAELIDEVDE